MVDGDTGGDRIGPDIAADLVAQARATRQATGRRRSRQALAISATVALVWLVVVTVNGHWARVADRWVAALTMVFGSIVAGSTPQGGGAIAFPVFTKVLEVPATVARSFSLCIQTVGMGSAAAAIMVSGRRIDWRSIGVLAPAAVGGFLGAAWLLGQPDEVFWPSRLPGPYVKVTFTIVVAAMALLVWMSSRSWVVERVDELAHHSVRADSLLVFSGLAGGVASYLVGSGADVFTYLGLVALLGLSAGIGVPTSVVVMAIVSTVGFVLFGLIDGQLAIELTGDQVTAVGGQVLAQPLPAARYDLFGLWLAAVPVVGFGAPLGSWAASKVSDRTLARIVVGLALVEVVTTVIFLRELRTDPVLVLYATAGLVTFSAGLAAVFERRHRLLAIPPVDTERTLLPRRALLHRDRRPQAEETSG